jgi:hypothetical protein
VRELVIIKAQAEVVKRGQIDHQRA